MKRCWFGLHDWRVLDWQNYWDTSWCVLGDKGAMSNWVMLGCKRCKKTKRKINYAGGHLPDDWLKREME